PALGVAIQALKQHLRIVDLHPVRIPHVPDDHLDLMNRRSPQSRAELEWFARNKQIPSPKRSSYRCRKPDESLDDVRLTRRVRAIDPGDSEHTLRKEFKAPCCRPVLINGDHGQFNWLQDRTVVGSLEPEQHRTLLAVRMHANVSLRQHPTDDVANMSLQCTLEKACPLEDRGSGISTRRESRPSRKWRRRWSWRCVRSARPACGSTLTAG